MHTYRTIFFVALLTFPILAFAQYPNAYCPTGFVVSRTGTCVQEICPVDTIGRDAREQCLCPQQTVPVFESGLLISCKKALKPMVTPLPAASTTLPVETISTTSTTSGALVIPAATTTTATTTRMSPGIRWPVARPTTVTLIFLLALGIAYWLYTHPAKK